MCLISFILSGKLSFLFQTFTEGLTNQLIGCYVGSVQEPGCVLVRLHGRMTELYVNRDQEVEMFQIFHAHGCGPQIYCSFQNGICYEFIRGTVLDDELLQQPSIYRSRQQQLSHFNLFLLQSWFDQMLAVFLRMPCVIFQLQIHSWKQIHSSWNMMTVVQWSNLLLKQGKCIKTITICSEFIANKISLKK